MIPSVQACVRAVSAKDARFDGMFFTAVITTKIYCRPSCPVVPPKPANMRFYASAAGAQAVGFRACKRCRPDATPGSPDWDLRADLVARAMRLIADGEVDRNGVLGLAARLGYSRRQLERSLVAELGAGPLALARSQRAQNARLLAETTTLPLARVAFAAGFGSVRQFNDTVQQVFALTPTQLRERCKPSRGLVGFEATTNTVVATRAGTPVAGTLAVRLPFREPLYPADLFRHLVATAVPGVEEWREGAYRRTLRLPGGPGIAALRLAPGHVAATFALSDLRDLAAAVARCRRLLDLDADPVAVDEALAADKALAPLVQKAPGRRVPRTVDEHELALRVVLGQQVSTTTARAQAGRLSAILGEPVNDLGGGLTHLFPTAQAVWAADPEQLAMSRARRATLLTLAAALAHGAVDLSPGADRDAARAALSALPGLGPGTVETIAMRALGDPDAFPDADVGIATTARALGLPGNSSELRARARGWQPWRAYAAQHLWAVGEHPANHLGA